MGNPGIWEWGNLGLWGNGGTWDYGGMGEPGTMGEWGNPETMTSRQFKKVK